MPWRREVSVWRITGLSGSKGARTRGLRRAALTLTKGLIVICSPYESSLWAHERASQLSCRGDISGKLRKLIHTVLEGTEVSQVVGVKNL